MLVVDLMMLGAILFRSDLAGTAGDGASPRFGTTLCEVSPRTELNLFSGLAHVAAEERDGGRG